MGHVYSDVPDNLRGLSCDRLRDELRELEAQHRRARECKQLGIAGYYNDRINRLRDHIRGQAQMSPSAALGGCIAPDRYDLQDQMQRAQSQLMQAEMDAQLMAGRVSHGLPQPYTDPAGVRRYPLFEEAPKPKRKENTLKGNILNIREHLQRKTDKWLSGVMV